MKNSKYVVYIDMDGVVSDFEGKLKEISDGKYGSPSYTTGMLWSDVKRWDQHVEPFFESLSKMPGADELVEFITSNFERVGFLSAGGTTPKDNVSQKKNWVSKNYPGMEVIVVGSSVQKAVYANPRAVLVDDRSASIDPWVRSGGIGILHLDNSVTMNELGDLLG